MRYNPHTDRLTGHWRGVSTGWLQFELDELELGARAALTLDEEDQAWWLLIGTPWMVAMEATMKGEPHD